jgi:hypothetical protein
LGVYAGCCSQFVLTLYTHLAELRVVFGDFSSVLQVFLELCKPSPVQLKDEILKIFVGTIRHG